MPGNLETRASEAGPDPDMNAVNESALFASRDFAGAFTLLAGMTQDFAQSRDIETTLGRALEKIVAHLDGEVGSLWLIEEEGQELVCWASVGPHPITGMQLPVTQGIIGRCVRENWCAKALDAQNDPEFARVVDEKSGFVTRSLLCAPLSFSDRPLGAIQVVNKRSESGCFPR